MPILKLDKGKKVFTVKSADGEHFDYIVGDISLRKAWELMGEEVKKGIPLSRIRIWAHEDWPRTWNNMRSAS